MSLEAGLALICVHSLTNGTIIEWHVHVSYAIPCSGGAAKSLIAGTRAT